MRARRITSAHDVEEIHFPESGKEAFSSVPVTITVAFLGCSISFAARSKATVLFPLTLPSFHISPESSASSSLISSFASFTSE